MRARANPRIEQEMSGDSDYSPDNIDDVDDDDDYQEGGKEVEVMFSPKHYILNHKP